MIELKLQELIEKLRTFLEENYLDKIHGLFRTDKRLLEIDFKTLLQYDSEVANLVLDNPEETIKAFQIAAEEFDIENIKEIVITFKDISSGGEKYINRLRQKNLGKLILIKGIVVSRTKVYPRIISSKFECSACGNIINVPQSTESFKEPSMCSCGRKGKFPLIKNALLDTIMLKIEELPERLIGSEQPYELRITFQGPLCESDYELYLGSRIEVIGILKEVSTKSTRQTKTVNCDFLMDCINYKNLDSIDFDITTNKKEKELFEYIKSKKNPARLISTFLYKDIHGHTKAKEAIIYQQFGGTRYNGKRDFINILLFGFQGVSKTDLATRATYINPIARISVGTHSSGVGLTATVKKDELTGNWTCVGGFLPRCNNGLAVIDEIEKMRDFDKDQLHMPMESGYLHIEKAGISAKLVANASILATSNPKVVGNGLDLESNCDITATILDRFDLIFKFSDFPNRQKDMKIAENITNRATFEGNETTFEGNSATFEWKDTTFPIYTLKKYIYKCRQTQPKLSRRVENDIHTWYTNLRESSTNAGFDSKKPTPRVIESILRLARAICRSKMKEIITKKELQLAITYFDFIYSDSGPHIVEEEEEIKDSPFNHKCSLCGKIPSHTWSRTGKPLCKDCKEQQEVQKNE